MEDITKNSRDFSDYGPLQNLVNEFNIKRILVVCVIMLFFVVLGSFNGARTYSDTLYYISAVILTFILIAYFIYIKFIFKIEKYTNKQIKIIYLSFWVSVCLALIPINMGNAMIHSTNLDGILYFAVLVAIPIFSFYEALFIYGVYLVSNISVLIAYGASAGFYAFLLGLVIAGFVISYIIQGQYVSIMSKLKQEVDTDYLTRISNRKGGLEKMKTVFEMCKYHNKLFAVYMIDIDHFKDYNDKFGHSKGDKVLSEVANCIKQFFYQPSAVVFRMGGEEFTVCCSVNSKLDAEESAKNLLLAVESLKIESAYMRVSRYVTVSVGYTVYLPEKQKDEDITERQLIEQADKALYRAKNSGRNISVGYDESFENGDVNIITRSIP